MGSEMAQRNPQIAHDDQNELRLSRHGNQHEKVLSICALLCKHRYANVSAQDHASSYDSYFHCNAGTRGRAAAQSAPRRRARARIHPSNDATAGCRTAHLSHPPRVVASVWCKGNAL